MLYRKRVHLNAGFLNGFWLGRQVQHTLPDSTGHIEPVYHVLIVVLALTVGTRIDLLFRGVIVYARCGTARCAGSQARDAGGHGDQSDQVPADDRQLRNRLILKGEVNAAICGIDDRRLSADHHRLADRAHFEGDRYIQILLRQQRDVRLRF